MAKLFEETKINGMVLANRFVRSATYDAMSDADGRATNKLINSMIKLAKGGVGLIVTGETYIHKGGQARAKQLGIHSDDLIPSLAALADAVHKYNSRIVIQMAHGGFVSKPSVTGLPTPVVSLIEGMTDSTCHELTVEDIGEVVQAFAQAAARAKKAGCDGVQFHSAHGYLLSQFLSPAYNHRTDAYGGSAQNRGRIIVEALKAIRDTVGPDYPVLIKMNSRDFIENGLELEDSLQVAKLLEENGLDAIEMSGGMPTGKLGSARMGIKCEEDEAYLLPEAKAFRETIKIPLILVGGIRSYAVAERIIAAGTADYVALCRPLIREPGLINRWRSGDLAKSICLSCNRCFGSFGREEGLCCMVDKD